MKYLVTFKYTSFYEDDSLLIALEAYDVDGDHITEMPSSLT